LLKKESIAGRSMSKVVKKEVVDLSQLFRDVEEVSSSSSRSDNAKNAATNNNVATAHLIVDCHCQLGEGILFDDENNTILWTDILASRFHMLELNSSNSSNYQVDDDGFKKARFSTHQLPKMLCSFGMLSSSSSVKNETINSDKQQPGSLPLLCAWQDGFQLYDVIQGMALSNTSIGDEDVNPAKGPTRLNDGRVDPTGTRFVCGGYFGEQTETRMKIFKVEQPQHQQQPGKQLQIHHEAILDDIRVTNSICWSLDGNTMYLADSPTRQIHSYHYDKASGKLSDKALLHTKTESKCAVPDGSCVDEQGYIWNAVWRDGQAPGMVQRVDPCTGDVVFTVQMPDTTSQVSCCCFGGPDLNILFITTAAVGRDHDPREGEPHAGGLYAVKLPFKGCLESRLKFQLYSRPY
jgi:L-arabinonolactonase